VPPESTNTNNVCVWKCWVCATTVLTTSTFLTPLRLCCLPWHLVFGVKPTPTTASLSCSEILLLSLPVDAVKHGLQVRFCPTPKISNWTNDTSQASYFTNSQNAVKHNWQVRFYPTPWPLTEQTTLKVPVHNNVNEQGEFVLSCDSPHSTSLSKQSSSGRSLFIVYSCIYQLYFATL
jgi:hypothetical protein